MVVQFDIKISLIFLTTWWSNHINYEPTWTGLVLWLTACKNSSCALLSYYPALTGYRFLKCSLMSAFLHAKNCKIGECIVWVSNLKYADSSIISKYSWNILYILLSLKNNDIYVFTCPIQVMKCSPLNYFKPQADIIEMFKLLMRNQGNKDCIT
jgi:hypothetical protein